MPRRLHRRSAPRAPRRAAAAFGAWTAIAAIAAAGPAPAQSQRYVDCLERARDNPTKAREEAAQWQALGGGAEAKHCGAIALIGLGAEGRAAMLLTEVGSEKNSSLTAPDRAAALMLAGDLWLRLERPGLAGQSYERAELLSPGDAEAMTGRAKAAAAAEDYAAAEGHLTRTLGVRPNHVEALILRAAARRKLDRPEAALADLERALALERGAPIAWFEKGAAEKALGRDADARESWLIAAQLDPVGAVGDLARDGLQRMLLGD